ncbi:isoprenylcysteine carboxylmethyltransferase family protein [Chloroflexota bacterium]|nr:isoprenylcysteine carboxylmethyltransferase family protein [Chloroflexota bacterium]
MKSNKSPNHIENNKNIAPPKIFAWLASLTLISIIAAAMLLPHGQYLPLKIAGVSILVIAAVFIFTPFFLLQKSGNASSKKSYMETTQVVDKGLYAITRHPQYLGYMLMSIGFACITQYWVIYLLATICIIFFVLQSIQEEHFCASQYGESYVDYLNRVPRFNIFLGLWRKIREK